MSRCGTGTCLRAIVVNHVFREAFLFLFLALFLANCGSGKQQVPPPDAPTRYEVVRTLPAGLPRPEWTLVTPSDREGMKHFVGVSEYAATEQAAREAAMQNARNTFAKYTGVEFKAIEQELSVSHGLASEVQDPTVATLIKQKEEVNALFGRLKATHWYIEQSNQMAGKTILKQAWQAWALVTVPVDEYDRAVAWREKQEKDAQQFANDILAGCRARKQETDALLAAGKPIAALDRLQGEWKRVEQNRESLKQRGWPYNKPQYDSRLEETQRSVVNHIRDARDAIVLDCGRYCGTVYVASRQQEPAVTVWALCRASASTAPAPDVPLILLNETDAPIARAITNSTGKAVFYTPGVQPGQAKVKIDMEAPAIRAMGEEIAKVLAQREIALRITAPGGTLQDVVLLGVRGLFQGPSSMPLPVSTVSLGPVTFENENQQDTRQGGRFAEFLKVRIRDNLTKIDGLTVMDPKTRTVETVAQAAKTRDLLNESEKKAPPVQSTTVQALIDGAQGALESRYTVYGSDVQLTMNLKKAGTDVVLASSVATIPMSAVPEELQIRPSPLPMYDEMTASPAQPIQVEVTPQKGDGATYVEGEETVYFVSTDRDAYLLLIYEDAGGSLTQVLPNSISRTAFYKAGKFFKIPEGKSDAYGLEVTAPFGTERLWVFASNKAFPVLSGKERPEGKLLGGDMGHVLSVLRAHGSQSGVAYGEARTILTTVGK
jgi:hypothetical protein